MLLSDLEKTILPHVGKAAKMMGIYMVEKFKEHHLDLTREQFILLMKLHEQDGRIQNDLAMITERNKASLTRLINTMEKKNLVARIPSKTDKRINCIHLTKHGRKTFKMTRPIINQITKEIQKGIRKDEIQTVIKVMDRILTNIK